jgi:precorrin-6B methylase 2
LSSIIDEHRTYLSDYLRLRAYTSAIHETVRPGDVVLDLGCGTGILGLLACRAGASRVYAIDSTGMIEVARRLARDNGMSDRIVHLNELSLQVRLPERVDVVVCDQMSSFAIEGGVVEYLIDARERFLKPGGRLIPRQLTLEVAPVEMNELRAQVEFWGSMPAGFEFGSVRKWAVNNRYTTRYRPTQLLSEPVIANALNVHWASNKAFSFAGSFEVNRSGTFEGIAGWFRAQLSASATISNSPLDANAIDRHAAFFPVERAVAVCEGDVVGLEMHVMPLEQLITWKTSVTRRANSADAKPVEVAAFVNSTFNGLIVSREHLSKTHPSFRPRLTRRGQARAFALALCNGKRPLAEIEESLFEEYRDVFARRDEAGVFVSEVVARHSE